MIKEYIGDAVYVAFDGCHIILIIEYGDGQTNQLYLEPNVLRNLIGFVKKVGVKIW